MDLDQGYMSIVKICDDIIRQEYKNVALILVNEQGTIGYMLRLPDENMPEKYQNSSFLYGWLEALMERVRTTPPTPAELNYLSNALWATICITPPKPVAILDRDWKKTLEMLWKDHISPMVR